MKRIGILIACLLALACCAPAPAETVPAAGEGAAADPWEIPADNPIDAAIPSPGRTGITDRNSSRRGSGWRTRGAARWSTPTEPCGSCCRTTGPGRWMEAQYGFEAYLPGAVEVYAAVYDPQREPGESAAAAGYEAELCGGVWRSWPRRSNG